MKADSKIIELSSALLELQSLLNQKENKEAKYQQYFENNPIVFDLLGYSKSFSCRKGGDLKFPKDHKGYSPEPDFLAKNKRNIYEIIDIKTPFINAITVHEKKPHEEQFSSKIEKDITQMNGYRDYFIQRENRIKIDEEYPLNLTSQEDFDGLLIIGSEGTFNEQKIHKFIRTRKMNITLYKYTDILNLLFETYTNYAPLPDTIKFKHFKQLRIFLDELWYGIDFAYPILKDRLFPNCSYIGLFLYYHENIENNSFIEYSIVPSYAKSKFHIIQEIEKHSWHQAIHYSFDSSSIGGDITHVTKDPKQYAITYIRSWLRYLINWKVLNLGENLTLAKEIVYSASSSKKLSVKSFHQKEQKSRTITPHWHTIDTSNGKIFRYTFNQSKEILLRNDANWIISNLYMEKNKNDSNDLIPLLHNLSIVVNNLKEILNDIYQLNFPNFPSLTEFLNKSNQILFIYDDFETKQHVFPQETRKIYCVFSNIETNRDVDINIIKNDYTVFRKFGKHLNETIKYQDQQLKVQSYIAFEEDVFFNKTLLLSVIYKIIEQVLLERKVNNDFDDGGFLSDYKDSKLRKKINFNKTYEIPYSFISQLSDNDKTNHLRELHDKKYKDLEIYSLFTKKSHYVLSSKFSMKFLKAKELSSKYPDFLLYQEIFLRNLEKQYLAIENKIDISEKIDNFKDFINKMHNLFPFGYIKEKVIGNIGIVKTILKSNKEDIPPWLVELEDIINQFSRNSESSYIRKIYDTGYYRKIPDLRKMIGREFLSDFYNVSEDLSFYIDLLTNKSFSIP